MDATETQEAACLRDLFRLLVRVQKALRMYQGSNPVTEQLEQDLHQRLSGFLEENGRLDLAVRQFQILYDGTAIYEQRDRKDSLAFLFFRDGIRTLTFLPGLEADELRAFLDCLNRVGTARGEQDDLVTLFWEQDLASIRYLAVEELVEEGPGIVLEELLGAGAATAGVFGIDSDEEGGGSSPSWAGFDDLEQPVARLPTESAHLNELETEELRAQIAADERMDLARTLAELMVELTLLEPAEEERTALTRVVVEILDQRLEEGDLDTVRVFYRRLLELAASKELEGEPIDRLEDGLTAALASPERLPRILAGLAAAGEPDAETRHLLARLARPALATLLAWLPRIENPHLRLAIADAVAGLGPACVPELGRQLPKLLASADSSLPALLHILTRLPPESGLPFLHRLLHSPSPSVRRDASQVLGRYEGKAAERLWLELLGDGDSQLRGRALNALVRGARPRLWSKILKRLSETGFIERPLEEKRRSFAAVARLGGEEALPWFAELLQPSRRRWFLPRQEQEMLQAAVHALRTMGTAEAGELLRQLATDGDRCARAACQAELGGARTVER